MDGDLLMYLRAARSMAAFVGWCDGGSTDDGCAAASMDETTINSLHMLHQHNYDTGKALQALVKIINPKSVDKRWSDEDAKKFVRGLKQHGKNFFKIRKDLLPYKDTPSLVEYYYLWKKTPAASTTRPHRRHRRPAFRRQAPTPTLPQEDDLDDMSSASEASEMESDEEINQSSLIATTSAANHSTSSCSRCSVTKSNRWYEINKDNVICSECHLNDKVMIGQTDDDVPATCDPIGPEDDAGHSAMDDDAPPFMFRPVKEDSEFGSDVKKKELEGSQDGKVVLMNGSLPVKTELASSSAYDGYNSSSLVPSSYSSAASTTSSSIVKYETPGDMLHASVHQSTCRAADDDATKDMVMSSSSSSSSMLLPSSATVKYEVPCISTSMTSSSSSSSSMMFSDVKPQRAVASVAPTFQDGVSTAGHHYQSSLQPPSTSLSSSSQLISSSSSSSSSLSSSSFAQMSSSQSSSPSVPSSSSALTNHYKSPFTSQSHHVMNMQGRPPPPQSSSSSSSPSNSTPMLQQPSYSSLAYPVPYSFSMPPPSSSSSSSFFSSSSTNNMPEDMSIKSCKETTTNNNNSGYNNNYNSSSHINNNYPDNRNASNNSSNNMFTHSKQQQKHSQQQPHPHQQPQQQEPICHNISDDDDDENEDGGADVDCNVARSPSPPAIPACEQVYSSANSIFIRKWNRGGNMCSRSDLEFLPQKNSKWMMKKEERLLNKSSSSSSSSSSGHHHHGHQSHHKSSSSSSSHHHQSSAKESRRNEGRKDDDKTKSPMQNNSNSSRSSDAQITSSYAGSSHHLPPFAGSSSDRMSQRSGTGANAAASGMFHDPTPALSQLSAYARPHIGNQRLMNYPPSHSIQDYFRLPGIFPPGSREAMELDMDKHAWERDVRERELREMEFMEKLKQELELKSAAAAAGFDRLPHLPGASLDPIWIDMQRRLMASQLPLPSGAPPPSHLSGMFPPPGILSADLMQRERLEQIARSSQEQMAREGALLQLYQRYAHDPNMLQRQVSAYMASKAQESVHLVYHFAKADPLASAVSQSSSSSSNLPSSHLPPPPPLPSALHNLPPNHPLYAFARDPERMYMELLSRPPYNADPLLAQQVMSNLTAQAAAAAQQEALQRHLAMERDFPGNPMMH